MSRKLFLGLVVLALLTTTSYAQETTPEVAALKPVVAFVVERDMQTASGSDTGPDGLSNLVDIFTRLGTEPIFISLAAEVPTEAKVVVLVRPIQQIRVEYLARLWRHIENGNHLLVSIDPVNYPSLQRSTNGLPLLLAADYGMILRESFLAQDWFTYNSVANPLGSITSVYSDVLPNPISAPLREYNLPVNVWGARTIRVEAFGIASLAFPLVAARSGYAETNLGIFTGEDPEPKLELNLETDLVGRLIVGAMGINSKSHARVALLGDSELLQNGYGLVRVPLEEGSTDTVPLFPGNQIFAERLAAWLLELPVDSYPALPEGFTWLRLDGDGDDWDAEIASVTDSDASPVTAEAYNLERVRAFFNRDYLYLLVETTAAPALTGHAIVTISSPDGNGSSITLDAHIDGVVVADGQSEIPVDDAQMAVGDALEIRIPLRVTDFGTVLTVEQVCLSGIEPLDCLDSPFEATAIDEQDPVPMRFSQAPVMLINSPDRGRVNMRAAPTTDAETVTFFPTGTVVRAAGRNEAGDWIYIENARYSGWVLGLLGTVNTDIASLPVITP